MRVVTTFASFVTVVLVASVGPGAQSVPRHRTADARFASLAGYPFAPHYVEINGLRMHLRSVTLVCQD